MTRQQPLKQRHRPALQCFRQHCVIGVRKSAAYRLPRLHSTLLLIIIFIFYIQEYTVVHKKCGSLYLIITLANVNRFPWFFNCFNREEMPHTTVVKFTTTLCVRTQLKIQNNTFAGVHKTLQCTLDCNSVKSWPILKISAQLRPEINFADYAGIYCTYLLCQWRLANGDFCCKSHHRWVKAWVSEWAEV